LRQHNDDGSLKARINSKEIDCENHEVMFEIDGFSTVGVQSSQEEESATGIIGAVTFDGTDDYLRRGADLDGNADGKSGTLSFWIKMNGGDGTSQRIYQSTSGYIGLSRQSDNTLNLGMSGSSITAINLVSSTKIIASKGWTHILASWDTTANAAWLYVDDVDETGSPTINAAQDIDYTRTEHGIGAHASDASSKLDASLAEFYFNFAEFIDISQESNRRKFISENSFPVDLGNNCANPTDKTPIICLRGYTDKFITNNGSGGGFTEHGALANATPICAETTWTPDPLTVNEGVEFTQTSNCGTTRQEVGTIPCTLTEAYWDRTSAVAGTTVNLIIDANNCDGQNVSFYLYERDLIDDDEIDPSNIPDTVIQAGSASSTWTAIYTEDGFGDPEYVFTAQTEDGQSISSGELVVSTSDIDLEKPTTIRFGDDILPTNSIVNQNYISVDVETPSDGFGSITYTLRNPDGEIVRQISFGEFITQYTFEDMEDGTYEIEARVTSLGGISASTGIIYITLDTTPPIVNFINDPDEEIVITSLTNIPINVIIEEDNVGSILFELFDTNGDLLVSYPTDSIVSYLSLEDEGIEEGGYLYKVTVEDKVDYTTATDPRIITIDTVPPIIEYTDGTFDDNAHNNHDDIPIVINISDTSIQDVTFYLFDSNGNVVKEVTPEGVTLSYTFNGLNEGTYTYYVAVTDNVGRIGRTPLDRTITLDRTPPVISYATGTEDDYAFKNQDFAFIRVDANDDDFGSISFSLFPQSPLPGDMITFVSDGTQIVKEHNFDNLADGEYDYIVTLVDKAGNPGSTLTRRITLDTSSLTVNFDESGTNSNDVYIDQSSISMSVGVTHTLENQEITSINFSLFDASPDLNLIMEHTPGDLNTDSFTFDTLEDGAYFYQVIVKNDLGLAASTEPRKITLDTNEPVIHLEAIPEPLVSTGVIDINIESIITEANIERVDFSLFAAENADSFFFNINIDPDAVFLDLSSVGEGIYYYDFEVVDKTGHITRSLRRTIILDDTAPTISYIGPTPENKSFYDNENLTIYADITESNIKNVEYYLFSSNAVVWQNFSENIEEATFKELEDGDYSFLVVVTDNNEIEAKTDLRYITVDTTKPVISFESVIEDGSFFASPENIDIEVNILEENIKRTTYILKNETFDIISSAEIPTEVNDFILPDLVDGKYYYEIEVEDQTAHETITDTRSFTLDSTSPTVAYSDATKLNDSFSNQNYIYIGVDIVEENIDTVSYALYDEYGTLINRTVFTELVSEFTFTSLTEGVYSYDVEVMDKVGLIISTDFRQIALDTTIPVVNYAGGTAADGAYKNQSHIRITIRLEEENFDNLTFHLFNSNRNLINETSFLTPVSPFSFTQLADGAYYYNVSLKDEAGQVTGSNLYSIILDTTYPEIDIRGKSPKHNSIIAGNDLPIEVKITEDNLKNITYILFDELNNLTKQSNLSLDENYVFMNLDYGVYYYLIAIEDKVGLQTITSPRKVTMIPPTKFNGSSTDLSKFNSNKIEDLTFEIEPYGKIIYHLNTNLSGVVDLNQIINIKYNSIEVKADEFPDLNKPARISLNGLNFINPRILKGENICAEDTCDIISYSSGTLIFNVENFSIYTAEETPVEEVEEEPVDVFQEPIFQEPSEEVIEIETRPEGIPEEQEAEIKEPEKGYGKIIAILLIILVSVLLAGSYLYLRYSKKYEPLTESPKFKPIGDGRRAIDFNFKNPLGRKVLLYILTFKSRYPKQTIKNQLLKAGWSDALIEKAFRIVQEKQDNLYYLESPKFELKGRKIIDYDFKSHNGRRALLYIQTFRSKSYSKQAIKAQLLKAGWPDNIIGKAFKIVQERHDNIHHFESPKFRSLGKGKKILSYNFKSLAGKEVLQYIHTFSLKGYSKAIIKSKLTKAGWPDNIVKEAFKLANKKSKKEKIR